MNYQQRIQAGSNVVEHDTGAPRQRLKLARWRRFQNIESSKKYKAGKNILPSDGNRQQGHELSGNLVDDHMAGVLVSALPCHNRTSRDADRSRKAGQKQSERQNVRGREVGRQKPQQDAAR